MGKMRKDPSKKSPEEEIEQPEDLEAGENELGEEDDFDHFLETMDDDSSDSEDEADPSQNDDDDDDDVETETDTSDDDNNDDDDEEDSEMEPEEEEDRDLNEDEEESDEQDSDDQSDNQEVDDGGGGEEGIPTQNGIGGGEGTSSDDAAAESEDEEGGAGGVKELSAKKHKEDLQKLQETDPEFFAFLKENDANLLEFNDSEEDDESDSEEEEAVHKPPETLEEASDSEAEEERLDETSDEHKSKVQKFLKKGMVDINVITYWQSQLSSTRDITVLTNVVEALKCAVTQLSEAEPEAGMKWRVDGSANFNALLRLCIKEIKGFCIRFLMGNNNVAQSENKFDQRPLEVRDKSKNKWTRLRPKIKTYMEVLVKLFKCMGNPDAVATVLRHCLKMSGFWSLFATKSYKMLRALVNIWSQGDDACRVLAFLTIIRMTNYNKDVYLAHMFKQMYIAYVANCKFTSVNTWPAINFMRSSLVELYLLDTSLAYSIAFPFIRQLAIHLRNALSPNSVQSDGKQKKSEASRVVYSWQFIHSLHLWADVLAQAGNVEDENLKLLIYPVVQICMGTIKLIPTRKYVPIRFHIVRMLIKLQEKAGVFIPVLPLITEVLRLTDFSSKSASKFSVRPIDLTCCLKADTAESGYLKAVSENVFETILAYTKAIGTDLGFPEIVTPTVMFLRTFLKKQCKNAEVSKKFKLLLEKIEANSKYISERRNKALENGSVTLVDKKSHKILQVQMETTKPHPPIIAYAAEYFKVNQKVQLQSRKPPMQTKEEKLIPRPSALKKTGKKTAANDTDFEKPLFDSDSAEDDSDSQFVTKLDSKSKSGQKRKRKISSITKGDGGSSGDDDDANGNEESQGEAKKKKKKGKKLKKKKESNINNSVDDLGLNAKDQLVDFELSD